MSLSYFISVEWLLEMFEVTSAGISMVRSWVVENTLRAIGKVFPLLGIPGVINSNPALSPLEWLGMTSDSDSDMALWIIGSSAEPSAQRSVIR